MSQNKSTSESPSIDAIFEEMLDESMIGLPIAGYTDTPIWVREMTNGILRKRMIFPITRFDNLVGGPKVTNDINSVATSAFHMLRCFNDEMPADKIFNLAGQTWKPTI